MRRRPQMEEGRKEGKGEMQSDSAKSSVVKSVSFAATDRMPRAICPPRPSQILIPVTTHHLSSQSPL